MLYTEARGAHPQGNSQGSSQGGPWRAVIAELGPATFGPVGRACRDNGFDMRRMMLACWGLLVWRLAGRREAAVWEVVDGRKYDELRTAIGPYSRSVPVRVEAEAGESFG